MVFVSSYSSSSILQLYLVCVCVSVCGSQFHKPTCFIVCQRGWTHKITRGRWNIRVSANVSIRFKWLAIFFSFVKCPLCYCARACHNEHVRLIDRMSAKRRKGDAAGEVWGWGSGGGRQQVFPHCWVWGQRHRKRKRRGVKGPWQGSRSWRLSVHIAFQLSAHSGHGPTSFALTSRIGTSTRLFSPPLFFFSSRPTCLCISEMAS